MLCKIEEAFQRSIDKVQLIRGQQELQGRVAYLHPREQGGHYQKARGQLLCAVGKIKGYFRGQRTHQEGEAHLLLRELVLKAKNQRQIFVNY